MGVNSPQFHLCWLLQKNLRDDTARPFFPVLLRESVSSELPGPAALQNTVGFRAIYQRNGQFQDCSHHPASGKRTNKNRPFMPLLSHLAFPEEAGTPPRGSQHLQQFTDREMRPRERKALQLSCVPRRVPLPLATLVFPWGRRAFCCLSENGCQQCVTVVV